MACGHADARWRAGEDQVARLEREDLRKIRDQLVDPEDELVGVRVLHGLAIQAQTNAQVVGIGNLVGRDELGTDRRERVKRLARHPLLAGLVELPVAGGHVVADGITADILEGPLPRRYAAPCGR